MMLYTKYEKYGPCSFRHFFLKLDFKKPIFDPVTYLCNQSEPFEQFLLKTTQGQSLLRDIGILVEDL